MKDRTVAILLCFFLGGFGIHKFYLGNNTAGIIYLIFSWTFIPAIVAFFDFFGLCFMSDREFSLRFNYGGSNALGGGGMPVMPSQRSAKESTATMYELKKMYDDGMITAEEYEAKRRKMLDDI